MGVYIKDMAMPTSPVLFCIHPDGKVYADLEGNWREYKAVPVPPHGRLIDADALSRFGGRKGLIHSANVDNAPTIIPAEEG